MGGKFSIFYGDEFLAYDFGREHPLRQYRVKLAVDLMREVGVTTAAGVSVDEARKGTIEDLCLFHTPEYVDFVRAACATGSGWLDAGDTPAARGGFDAALYVVGTAVGAARDIWQGHIKHAYNLGGGLHHAHPARASGFCIFNDIAVAVVYLQKVLGAKRLAYIDIDAHQGDGMMYGFYSDPRVLDIDFHEDGRYLFPGTGRVSELGDGPALNTKVNVPFPPYSADNSFGYAFSQLIPDLIRRFAPEIILMQTGVDTHRGDPLTHMDLSFNSYVEALRTVHDLAHEVCDGRLLLFGGGGYDPSSVAIGWTLMAATVVGVPVGGALPERWRAEHAAVAGVAAPEAFEEDRTEDDSHSEVMETVHWLRSRLLPE